MINRIAEIIAQESRPQAVNASALARKIADALKPDWQPIETAPQDGTNFLVACLCIADEYDDQDRIVKRGVRERYIRVAQVAFGTVNVIPFNGGRVVNEFFTHWAPLPELPPE